MLGSLHRCRIAHLAIPSIFPSLKLHLCCFSSATEATTANGDAGEAPEPHPWPEWVSFVDSLKNKGYLIEDPGDRHNTSEGDGGAFTATLYKNFNRLNRPCIRFARDRFDIIKSLARIDIQLVVQSGCPSLFQKAVVSAKRLRAYVGLDEGDVCCLCDQRDSCDKAYLILKESESTARTVDIVRIVMLYAVDPLVFAEATPGGKLVESSARKLLSELTKLSETPLDPALPKPVFRASIKKEEIANNMDDEPPKKMKMIETDWFCPRCNTLNFSRNLRCFKCKADGIKKISSVAIEMGTGDWYCRRCMLLNFPTNEKCMRCRDPRPGVLSRTGDWGCPTCGFLNFKRNLRCLKCSGGWPEA